VDRSIVCFVAPSDVITGGIEDETDSSRGRDRIQACFRRLETHHGERSRESGWSRLPFSCRAIDRSALSTMRAPRRDYLLAESRNTAERGKRKRGLCTSLESHARSAPRCIERPTIGGRVYAKRANSRADARAESFKQVRAFDNSSRVNGIRSARLSRLCYGPHVLRRRYVRYRAAADVCSMHNAAGDVVFHERKRERERRPRDILDGGAIEARDPKSVFTIHRNKAPVPVIRPIRYSLDRGDNPGLEDA